MKSIPLTQGKFAIVDDDVYEWASKVKWFAQKVRHTFYAVRAIRLPNGKQHPQLLHREILKALPGIEVDHIDGNGLNDLLENLRPCSHAENVRNRRKQCNNASGYKGVDFSRRERKFQARIMVNGIRKRLGYFDTAEEAARARDAAAVVLHGEFASLNFPIKSLVLKSTPISGRFQDLDR